MRRALQWTTLLLLVVALSGCLQVHRPVVSPMILANADHDWTVREGPIEGGREFAPRVIETEYRYEPEDGDEGYPGLLVLVGLRALQRIEEDQLLDATREILAEEMEAQGVQADTITEETGRRTLQSGIPTSWFTMTGTAQSDSILFQSAREIRVLGEAWFDEESNMHVVAIVIAQTVQSDFVGGQQRDHGVWNELVGDADGSIEGAVHTEGFIDHAIIQY